MTVTRPSRLIAIAAGLLVVVLGADNASAGGGCHTEQLDEATTSVELTSMCFRPAIVRVTPGSRVEFINRDPMAHNVVGYGGSWGTFDNVATGASVSAEFPEAGIYPFSCTIHPGMVGAIVVGDATAPAAASPPSTRSWTTIVILGASAISFMVAVWHWSKPNVVSRQQSTTAT